MLTGGTDARNFCLASTVISKAPGGNACITTEYRITDNPAASAKVFYKPVSEDLDGSSGEYGVISSNCNSGSIEFSQSENPAHTQCALNINGIVTAPVIVNIYNTAGQKIYATRTASAVLLRVSRWSKDIFYYYFRSTE